MQVRRPRRFRWEAAPGSCLSLPFILHSPPRDLLRRRFSHLVPPPMAAFTPPMSGMCPARGVCHSLECRTDPHGPCAYFAVTDNNLERQVSFFMVVRRRLPLLMTYLPRLPLISRLLFGRMSSVTSASTPGFNTSPATWRHRAADVRSAAAEVFLRYAQVSAHSCPMYSFLVAGAARPLGSNHPLRLWACIARTCARGFLGSFKVRECLCISLAVR